MSTPSTLRKRLTALVSATALVLGSVVVTSIVAAPVAAAADPPPGPQPIMQRPATMPTADVLPTVQIDGVVWSQVVKGNTVYAGGQFSNARPAGAAAGTNLTPRGNLLAYDITTGNLITSFAPNLNGAVQAVAVSPDGTRLYVGGLFTTANGQTRGRLAAYNTSTGALLSWSPWVNYQPRSIVATDTTVYVGGSFQTANGVARNNLAAFNASNGQLTAWAPDADRRVNGLVRTPDGKIIAGGDFGTVNGSAALGLAALDPVNGTLVPWNAGNTVQSYGSLAGFWSLSIDNDTVYGTGWNYGGTGNLEGTFAADAATGDIKWVEDCHGDTYGAYSDGNVVFTVSHAHYCTPVGGFPQSDPWATNQKHALVFTKAATGTSDHNIYGGYADWYGTPAPTMINWFADPAWGNFTSQAQAAWNVTGNGEYVVMGGEFPSVSQTPQQGLVRFAIPSKAPKKERPRNSGPNFVPTLVGLASGTVRVSWPLNWDRDDLNLTYRVYRDNNTANPVYTTTATSTFWNRPTIGFIDTGLTPGQTYNYKVYASDGDGNLGVGNNVSIVAPSTGSQSPYSQKVTADGAAPYWRLGEASGTAVIDTAGFNDGVVGAGVTRGTAGAIGGDPNTASTFDGSSTASASTQTAITGPDTFTVEAWVKTTSTSGGKIIGFGSSNSGNSSSYDRHVYMDNSGRIYFGVYPGGVRTVNSAASYNDGNYHHVVASLGANGMNLYVDDLLVGSRGDVTTGQPYSGYWRVGGDNLNGWPSQPSSLNLSGSIDDVAIYPTVLTRAQIDNHFVLSGRTSTIPAAPADPYGAAVYADNPALYWRLGESTGTTAADSGTNSSPGIYSGGVTKGVTGAIFGTTNTAGTFNGTSGLVASQSTFTNPTTYSEELWFKTTTNQGGKLIGLGNAQSGLSSGYDRHVYMETSGQLTFGTWTGQANTITSPNPYNNGQWHHLVVSQESPAGMKMYVDGALVGTNPQTAAQDYTGYWRVGGDVTWNNTEAYWQGTIDDVAIYSQALPAARVAQHYSLGATGSLPNQQPTASFTSTVTGLSVGFNGSASADPDGTVAGYSWNFGDGTPAGTGPTPTHVYATAGTYTVTLTVTDDKGATGTSSAPVAPTHAPPVAAFTSSAAGLTASFDASTTTTSDSATITSYSWDFGDGSPPGSGATPTHGYATGGTKTVTLTVTDSKGATGTKTGTVAVAHAAPSVSFTSSSAGLTASFSAAATATDGAAITGYSWDFGDGTPAGSGATPTHTYATGGTKTVTLTVTDSLNATGTATNPVAITAPHTPPTAAFTSSAAGLTASFDASTATAADGATITGYSWDFGDGTPAGSGKTPTHTYTSGGTKTVILTVTDSLNATGTSTGTVAVTHAAPTVSFTSTPAGLTASFSATATASDGATITGYSWDFGDGSPAGSGASPSHTYSSGATRTVTLTVTDSLGGTGTSSAPVTVAHAAPSVSFTSSSTGLTANFVATATATDGASITGYSWNFGDGSPAGSGPTPSHTYATGGTKTVILTVTDSLNATGTATNSVPIQLPHTPPTASFTSSTSGLTATFDASASSASDGATVTGYSWDFGDGSPAGTGKTPSHTYTSGGTKTVILTVTDSLSATGTSSAPVAVAHAAPSVSFTSTPAGLTVNFAAQATATDNATITGYSWDFGDGTPAGSGASPTHTYASGGTKTVTVTVTDSLNATNTSTAPVTVGHAAPSVSFTSTSAGLTASFSATATASDGATITGYSWNFGDGSPAGSGPTPSHTYTTAGTKTVTLTVTDSLSGTGTATNDVTVGAGNQLPTASFTSSVANMVLTADGSGSVDPDGSIVSYSWDYGDGSPLGSGVTTSHSYAAAGTYQVKLTVTDNATGTGTITNPVVVAAPAIAMDQFSRTVSNGWGTANQGGAWTVTGTAANYSVASGFGKMRLPTAGSGTTATLGSVSKLDTDTGVSFTTDMPVTGAGVYFTTVARKVGNNYYGAKLVASSSGKINAYLTRTVNDVETTMTGAVVSGVSFTAGAPVRVRFQVATGAGTTNLKVKVWNDGQAEPGTWAVSTTDNTAALQVAGSIGFVGFLSGTATNAPVTVSVNNMVTTAP